MKHAILFLVALLGCGPSPTEQCETFIDTFCKKARVCTGFPVAQCKESFDLVIPCGKAVDVAASFDECLADIEKQSCTSLFPDGSLVLPANCNKIILFR